MTKIATICMLTLLVLSSCKSGKMNWKTTDNKEYMVSYPKNWVWRSKTNDILFRVVSPESSTTNVYLRELKLKHKDLDEFVMASIKYIDDNIPNNFLEKEKLEANNSTYYKVSYINVVRDVAYKHEQYIFTKNQKAYVISFNSANDKYEKEKIVGKQILNTFKLK